MGTAVIIIVLVLICVVAVKGYIKRMKNGCCGAGGDEDKKIIVKDKNIKNYPYLINVKIGGMKCKNCKRRVENALNSEEGILAKVYLKDAYAEVRTKEIISEEKLRHIIERSGYSAVNIERENVIYETEKDD